MQITRRMNAFSSRRVSPVCEGIIPPKPNGDTNMTDSSNQPIHELRDDELDIVCGGSETAAGFAMVKNDLALHALMNPGWPTWDTKQNKAR